jgi:8-oxo-dGTP diphosphatase
MHIHVACGIIERDGLILAARRSPSKSLPLKWEFPGGKMNPGESAEACVKREILEEMGVAIDIRAALPPSTHHYADFSVTLYPLICTIVSGKISLNEHAAVKWLSPEDLYSLDWAEADFPVLDSYLARLRDRHHKPGTGQR